MSKFGLAVLFHKYLRENITHNRYSGSMYLDRVHQRMAKMEKHEPGEWFKFLAWAAVQKASRQQEKWNEPQ